MAVEDDVIVDVDEAVELDVAVDDDVDVEVDEDVRVAAVPKKQFLAVMPSLVLKMRQWG